tara:strand:- start:2549 stop:3739 length:1191 start_codon:yes stop_codon:yes gene_type:complete
MNKIKTLVSIMLLPFLLGSCVEEFMFENETFEKLLVVDATLTNEDKFHRIKLSETFPFGNDNENPLQGATVTVDANGSTLTFEEIEPGTYQAATSFSALPDVAYRLQITLANGKQYQSSVEQLTPPASIDNLYGEREVSEGSDGVSILINSTGSQSGGSYYRYEYIETFRLDAPLWRTEEAYVVENNFPNCIVDLRPRSTDEITCYRTEVSRDIPLAATSDLTQNTLERFQVNFLPVTSYKIGYRYSVLVRQLVQTEQAYNYFKVINSFSSDTNLFSQVQAGFIAGNIQAMQSEEEKVVGYFGVSSVAEERIFFNFRDFFPTEPFPPYIVDCELRAPEAILEDRCGPLVTNIDSYSYVRPHLGEFPLSTGPYIVALRACGYCTVVGSNEVPEFWVE